MPVITLPDEAQRAFPNPVSALEVARSISPALARSALAARVDGQLCDLSTVIADDARLALITERDAEGLEIMRHSCAHLMAMADVMADVAGDGDAIEGVATSDVAAALGKKPQSLSPARDSLLKKGLIYSGERGRIAFTVPHFGRYLRERG